MANPATLIVAVFMRGCGVPTPVCPNPGQFGSALGFRVGITAPHSLRQAREVQSVRRFNNSVAPPGELRKVAALDDAGERTLEMAIRKLGLSARAYDRILRVARTIAISAGQGMFRAST